MAAEAGLIGLKRALDSAPLFDAVATQDTVTLVRSAIRGLLGSCDTALEGEMRAALSREDDYRAAGKPPCDWDDAEAREQLVDALVRDGYAALVVLEGRELTDGVAEAAELLATVISQDIETRDDGTCAIARRVASDRVISTVDPETRHGRKTISQRFDGYKGHVAVDPDSEIITETAVTPGNVADAEVTEDLLAEFADADDEADSAGDEPAGDDPEPVAADEDADDDGEGPAVYGDAVYGSGDNLERLERLGADPKIKPQPATAPAGAFSKEDFAVDLATGTVTCPAGVVPTIAFRGDGSGTATFGAQCHDCPLRAECTTAQTGRSIAINRHEQRLAAQRARQRDRPGRPTIKPTGPRSNASSATLCADGTVRFPRSAGHGAYAASGSDIGVVKPCWSSSYSSGGR